MTSTSQGTGSAVASGVQSPGLDTDRILLRQVATHSVAPLPDKPQSTFRLDQLGGNTTVAMHLAQIPPGGYKCNHRHLDETLAYVIGGTGRTELRQSDYTAITVAEWEPGDVVVIPTNAWHRHVNGSQDHPARQLSFRNTPLMNRLLYGGEGTYRTDDRIYNQGGRFEERFNDEADYFTAREEIRPNLVRTNFVKNIVDEELPADDPALGDGVAVRYYAMGGQLTLNVALVGIRAGGAMREHNPLAEEGLLVLRGSGHTELRAPDGTQHTVSWQAGDVLCPPLGAYRRHVADTDVRLFKVRNIALERVLGLTTGEPALDSSLPDRFRELTT